MIFGTKTKEELVKIKQQTETELNKIEDAEKKEQDARKKQAQQEERQRKERDRRIAFYHLTESEPIRFLYLFQWIAQNPSLTVSYVDARGTQKHKTYTMQELVQEWQLTEFCKNLELLKSE